MSQSPELPDLDRLEALCAAARAFKWDSVQDDKFGLNIDGEFYDVGTIDVEQYDMHGDLTNEAVLNFCAACDPATVSSLISLARRAQPEGEAPQADVQAPSAAAIDDVVDNLREYADNAGYSHNDYQDTMRQAANTIEALRAQLWHWGPIAAHPHTPPIRRSE